MAATWWTDICVLSNQPAAAKQKWQGQGSAQLTCSADGDLRLIPAACWSQEL